MTSAIDTSEKRVNLQKRLEKDYVELEALQASLTRADEFSEKVVSIVYPHNQTSMLSKIDSRLSKLEGFIVPMHAVTQKLTKAEESVNRACFQVENVLSILQVQYSEHQLITDGILDENLDEYLDSMEKIRDSISKLTTFHYKSTETTIDSLKELQRTGILHLDSIFQDWLDKYCTDIDVQSRVYSKISDKINMNLLKLAAALAQSIADAGSISNFAELCKNSRQTAIQKALNEIHKSAKDQEQVFNGKSSIRYEKGSAILLKYYSNLLWVLQNEKIFIESLIQKPYDDFIFRAAISKEVDRFLELAEVAHSRIKKGIAKREYGEAMILLDLWDALNFNEDSVLENGGPKALQIITFKNSIKDTMVVFITTFLSEFNSDQAKILPTSPDGTVHELTSTTLNILKKLVDYTRAINLMLSVAKSPLFISISNFSHLVSKIMEILIIDLEIKGKGYKRAIIGTVFLMNNYHYVLKNIKNSRLNDNVEASVSQNFDKLLLKQMDVYRSSWIPCVEFLMDAIIIQDGTIVRTFTSKQKDEIKEKFKGFNEFLEEFQKTSQLYAIPDLDLRAQIVTDIKAVVLPMYNRFYDRYIQADFSKTPEKYIKYKKEALLTLLNKLYEET